MKSSSKNVDEYLNTLPQWQRVNLELFRSCIHTVASDCVEEIKWGVPVFLKDGKMLFAMSAFKAHTKFNFIQNGATLEDPDKLFNNGFDSKKSRAIDLREGESIDEEKLKALIQSTQA